MTDTAIGHLDVDDLLVELLGRVAGLMSVDTAAVLLLDEASQQLIARAAWGLEVEVRQGARVPVGRGFAGRIAVTRQPVILDRVDSTTVANPLLWEKGIRAMLGVPLQSGDELLGVLHVGSLTDRLFTEADADLLAHVANRVAAAVQAQELHVKRAASKVLQRGLLPAALPQVSGFEFATRYVPAQVGGIGGDWYDAFVLPDGNLWVMLGDVVGHGLEAAVIMGRLRSTLRAYALDDLPPDEVLARADRRLHTFEPGQTASVLCALLCPPYDSIQVSLAGHPPPVIAATGPRASLMDVEPGLLLGVDLHVSRATTAVALPAGAVVVAYTDGLVERPSESLDDGMARLCRSVHPNEPETVCVQIMNAMIGYETPHDDIAVLVLRRTPIELAGPTGS